MSLPNIAAGYQWDFASLDDLVSLYSNEDQRSMLRTVKNNVEPDLAYSSNDNNVSLISIHSDDNASIGAYSTTILPSSPAREMYIRTLVPAELPSVRKKNALLISNVRRLFFHQLFDGFKPLANPSDGEGSVSSTLKPASGADSNSTSHCGDLSDPVMSNRLRNTKDEPHCHTVFTTNFGKEKVAKTSMGRNGHMMMTLNEASKVKRGALHRSHRGSVITSNKLTEETKEVHTAHAIYKTRKGMHGKPQVVVKHGCAMQVEKNKGNDRRHVRRASASDATKNDVEVGSGSPRSRKAGFKKKSSRSCRPKPLQNLSASPPHTGPNHKPNREIKEIYPSTDAIRGATSDNISDKACPATHAEAKRYHRRKPKRNRTSSKTRVS
jgi:hypothetical protein